LRQRRALRVRCREVTPVRFRSISASRGVEPSPFRQRHNHMIRRALAAGVLMLITACGNPGTEQSPESTGVLPPAVEVNTATLPPPRSPQVLLGSQRLTSVNNGDKVKLAVGQRIDVSLGGFDPIDETGAALTVTVHRGGYPSSSPATGGYLAMAPGTATLQTTSDAACLHGKPPCEVPVMMWQVTVEVSATSS
jgi:hypothetical protein